MNKKDLSERDICSRYITPAIRDTAGWQVLQIFEEFTLGKIHVRGKSVARGSKKRADYILFYQRNVPLAVIEAKDNTHEIGAGMQQALEYAEILDVPFAYSSNGDSFVEHDRTATYGPKERVIGLHEFPSPEQLWQRYIAARGIKPDVALVEGPQGEAHPLPGRPQHPGRSSHDQRLQVLRRGDDEDHRPRSG